MNYNLIDPCEECPFLKDCSVEIPLTKKQAILHRLLREEKAYGCPKYEKEYRGGQHCAGALIFLLKIDKAPIHIVLASYVMYDPSDMDLTLPVYESIQAFLKSDK